MSHNAHNSPTGGARGQKNQTARQRIPTDRFRQTNRQADCRLNKHKGKQTRSPTEHKSKTQNKHTKQPSLFLGTQHLPELTLCLCVCGNAFRGWSNRFQQDVSIGEFAADARVFVEG